MFTDNETTNDRLEQAMNAVDEANEKMFLAIADHIDKAYF